MKLPVANRCKGGEKLNSIFVLYIVINQLTSN